VAFLPVVNNLIWGFSISAVAVSLALVTVMAVKAQRLRSASHGPSPPAVQIKRPERPDDFVPKKSRDAFMEDYRAKPVPESPAKPSVQQPGMRPE
jgi:hypothetical protein